MNHQVQTSYLVDNEWVSRPVDAYQFMAHDRESDGDPPPAAARPSTQVPELGILSRTLFASPLFNSVHPANIRHKDLNDIVLIGEDVLHLKEIHEYGRLRHVATKSDFKGRILAARVFGDPREIPMRVASPLPQKPGLHRTRRSMTGEDTSVIPPEVVVLTLSSRTLMFLWAYQSRTGVVIFRQRTIRLPAGASQFDRFGAFLAIDPRRRAMAVAAQEGRFILYKTKSMDRWRDEIQNGRETTPIEDERIFQLEGRVMHMEFLSSGAGMDDYHVVLLFVVVIRGKTKITCFDWDCREDLNAVAIRTERVAVDLHEQNPALLIPMSRTSDFLLVFDSHISVYKDVLSGTPRCYPHAIHSHVLPSIMPGDSKYRPRWVGWDKTPRNPDFPKEAFYVAREDGRIMYVEGGQVNGLETDVAGDWPYRIDTAFACLSVDNSEFSQSYPDVLIAGGAGNDGRLCKLGSWPAEYATSIPDPDTNQLSYIESISNWTPLTDLSVARLPGLSMLPERSRSSIFVANGSSPHGEVSDLRMGLQSIVDYSFGGMNGCTGMWVVDSGTQVTELEGRSARQHYATLVITMPPETLLIRILRTQCDNRGQSSGAWEDGMWKVEQLTNEDEHCEDGIMRDIETITACAWSENFAVQITRDEIRSLRRPGLCRSVSIVFTNPLLLAACKPGLPFIAIAFRESGNSYLEILRVSSDGSFVRDDSSDARLHLDQDPTCVELLEIQGIICVFVSTFGLSTYLFRVDDHGKLHAMIEDTLHNVGIDNTRMVIDGAVLMFAEGKSVLVCATRSGYLLSSMISLYQPVTTSFSWSVVKMGTTSVHISASATDVSTAFVSCGPDFCRARCSPSSPSLLAIDSVWLTNRARPGYLQSSLTAMYQVPHVKGNNTGGRDLGGYLFAVAGDEFHCTQLSHDISWMGHELESLHQTDRSAVPRKLPTGAKPTNILYLRPIRKLVVATMEAKEERAPPDGYRILHSAIKLLDVHDQKTYDEAEVKQEDGRDYTSRLVSAQYELKHGERVYSIAEWPFTDHRDKRYTLIIVGTGVPGHNGKESGRRLIFNVGKSESSARLELKKESTFDYPVYCTAIWNNNASVSAIGKTLTFDVFDSEAGLLKKRASIDLPSPAIHITVRAGVTYVSTLQHSHLCYQIHENAGKYEFTRVFTDSRERNCSTHLILDVADTTNSATPQNDTIVLVNDKKSASIAALYHAPVTVRKNAAPTIFEACLPHTVVRLQQGDIRPPWRRPAASSIAPTGVLNDDIIGACSDGTMYTFSILSKPARHMLRLVQNLVEEKEKRDPRYRDTPINSLRGSGGIADVLMNGAEGNQDEKIRALDVDPRQKERGLAAPRFKHVDGDALERWLRTDGDIDKLVLDGTEENVLRLFGEFVLEMWGEDIERGMDKVKEWLEEVFMPVL
ncbi:mono-functional DNA-alkylating methyl methanesulfonate N-term-domain-containing protein [Phaeosphaeria sp. MPI-PUGE-AT-0046c]|nr:mono-functional DNA-alkylating methyl methanesulfonate N-term-domain-containing protein [Phaeosphaeria sp. MPI-PUGE-AT-0046c]